MGRAGPCPSQRHGPWCLLPQGSRSSQRGEPYTERTLASQAAYTARWKQQEKLQEEVTEEFGAHAGPGWSEALCGKVGPAGGSRSWCFEVWLS